MESPDGTTGGWCCGAFLPFGPKAPQTFDCRRTCGPAGRPDQPDGRDDVVRPGCRGFTAALRASLRGYTETEKQSESRPNPLVQPQRCRWQPGPRRLYRNT